MLVVLKNGSQSVVSEEFAAFVGSLGQSIGKQVECVSLLKVHHLLCIRKIIQHAQRNSSHGKAKQATVSIEEERIFVACVTKLQGILVCIQDAVEQRCEFIRTRAFEQHSIRPLHAFSGRNARSRLTSKC